MKPVVLPERPTSVHFLCATALPRRSSLQALGSAKSLHLGNLLVKQLSLNFNKVCAKSKPISPNPQTAAHALSVSAAKGNRIRAAGGCDYRAAIAE
jgi:hypothetical protein